MTLRRPLFIPPGAIGYRHDLEIRFRHEAIFSSPRCTAKDQRHVERAAFFCKADAQRRGALIGRHGNRLGSEALDVRWKNQFKLDRQLDVLGSFNSSCKRSKGGVLGSKMMVVLVFIVSSKASSFRKKIAKSRSSLNFSYCSAAVISASPRIFFASASA